MTDSPTLRDYFEEQLDFNDFDPFLFGEDLGDTLSNWHGGRDGKNIEGITHDEDFLDPFLKQIDYKINDRLSEFNLSEYGRVIDSNSEFKIEAKEFGRVKARDNILSRDNLEESVNWLRKYHPQTLGGFRTQEKRRIREEFGIDLEVF